MKLSHSDKETIISELKAGNVSMELLAKRYGVHQTNISHVFKRITGISYLEYRASVSKDKGAFPHYQRKIKLKRAEKESQYRAWQKEEKQMYPVLGIDWFYQKVLIATAGAPKWYSMDLFILMRYSGLQVSNHTPDFPERQKIYVGDIVRFPILLDRGNGETQKTMHTDVVAFDEETGSFILVGLEDDPLALYSEECEVIGNICANPEMVTKDLYEVWCDVNQSTRLNLTEQA